MPEYSFLCEGCDNRWSIVCSITEYTDRQKCPSCKKIKTVFRDLRTDASNIYGAVTLSLSEVKTLGHYADKQTKKYGKAKCEEMAREFKTKKIEGGRELPDGMSRMERPTDAPLWPGETEKKKRKVRKKKK